jgi:hypothetical protein
MRRTALFLLVLAASASVVAMAGCDMILGLQHAELYQLDGGGGQSANGASSSASAAGGSGGAAPTCMPGGTQSCYTGPPGTEDAGACMGGIATCNKAAQWGACQGEITPQPRSCASTTDVACLGKDNCVQWVDLFGGPVSADARGVAVDAASNSYVVGVFSGTIQLLNMPATAKGITDIFVLKLDPTGAPVWSTTFGATGATISRPVVTADAKGNVAIGGVADHSIPFGNSSAGPGLFAAKLGVNGDIVWANGFTANYTGSILDAINGMVLTPAGDVIIGGVFTSSINFGDGLIPGPTTTNGFYGFVASLRSSDGLGGMSDAGVAGWHEVLCSGMTTCAVTGVAMAGSAEVLVAGDFTSTAHFGSSLTLQAEGTQDGFVAKLSLEGGLVWQQGIGGANGFVTPRSLAAAADGGPIVAGDFSGTVLFTAGGMPTSSAGAKFVARYGFDKSYQWSQVLQSLVIRVASDAVGNVLLAGQFMGALDLGGTAPLMSVGSANIFVAKLSNTPALIWSKQYGDANSLPAAEGIAVTPQGDPIIVGYTQGAINFGLGTSPAGQKDAFVVKMSP